MLQLIIRKYDMTSTCVIKTDERMINYMMEYDKTYHKHDDKSNDKRHENVI